MSFCFRKLQQQSQAGPIDWLDLGKEFLTNSRGMLVFPNPAHAVANLSFSQDWDGGMLQVFDLKGALVLTRPISAQHPHLRLSPADLSAGIYFFKATQAGQVVIQKVIKK